VNAAFCLTLDGKTIKRLALSYGGMAATTVMATKTAASLVGKWVFF
jgi:xanthine dehydrogenase iron-sulfur cluster and FAD-binding subunit A